MDSGRSTRALPRVGFPIRKSSDQRMVSSFPRLIAAAHVLHRLLAPRHPPCALSLLTGKNTLCVAAMEFSRCTWARVPNEPARRPVSQNSTALCPARRPRPGKNPRARSRAVIRRCVEVDVVLGESAVRTVSRPSTGRTPSGVRAPVFPRKEVIQPQLPLRLPCYDFTPIIDPTFDGCLPEGLAHRLRVLPTFVV
jgi:hypothetical protein